MVLLAYAFGIYHMDMIFFISSLFQQQPGGLSRESARKLPRQWFICSVSKADKIEVILNNKRQK